ncbi:hypothetical protein ASD00_19855 [Ensifer sp. Root31]|nr:hypothetical protein ASD00_19855 [Ensifer sp. Root31]
MQHSVISEEQLLRALGFRRYFRHDLLNAHSAMSHGNLFHKTRFLLIKQSGYVLRNPNVETTAMQHEDTRQQYSKVVRGWNTRYDLEEFISAHRLTPLVARELFEKFGPYKIDLDRKVAELRAAGKSNLGH